MDKPIRSPSLAHMAMLYGPRTEQELDAALGPFCQRRDEYRRRFQEDGIALTEEEAIKAYKLMEPLYAPDMTPDEAEWMAVQSAITFPCLESGRFGFREPAVKALLEAFERQIAERGSQPLRIQHVGEAVAREADSWERFVAFKALALFVEVMSARPITGEPRSDCVRAKAILDVADAPRPRGWHDPRLTLRRNGYIFTMLAELEGCGLPVTAADSDSLAGALACALKVVTERTIRDVWNEAPLRESQLNDALPAELRLPRGLVRRPRNDPEKPRIAPDERCAQCGRVGKVPAYRAREGGSRLCMDCEEW